MKAGSLRQCSITNVGKGARVALKARKGQKDFSVPLSCNGANFEGAIRAASRTTSQREARLGQNLSKAGHHGKHVWRRLP
jgi:hypothetical protein